MNPKLQQLLAERGILPTPQRLAVFGAVAGRRDHPSVDKVYVELRRKLPTLSKTTVYSTMQLLAEKRLIGMVHGDREELRFDGSTEFHAHFRCQACGRLYDIPLASRHEKPFAKLPRGFLAENEELIYHGTCPDCNNKKKGK